MFNQSNKFFLIQCRADITLKLTYTVEKKKESATIRYTLKRARRKRLQQYL